MYDCTSHAHNLISSKTAPLFDDAVHDIMIELCVVFVTIGVPTTSGMSGGVLNVSGRVAVLGPYSFAARRSIVYVVFGVIVSRVASMVATQNGEHATEYKVTSSLSPDDVSTETW
jgi:hypothetical protein